MSAEKSTSKKIHWVPLESSPEALSKVMHRVGVPASVAFSDVWGLDEELLAMVAQPVYALVFLFPSTDDYVAERRKQAECSDNKVSPNVWFMRQTIGNACGTMAMLHALGNNQSTIPIVGDLASFFEKVKDMTPAERAAELEINQAVAEAHKEGAADGQTEAPVADIPVEHHYVAFVSVDGDLYELDGTHESPINLGPSTNLLKLTIMAPLRLGSVAPNFSAETTSGPIDFHEFIGDSWAVLFSHPADFTPVCTTELGEVAKLEPQFSKRNVKVIGLSTNDLADHSKWVDDINEVNNVSLAFPIIADKDREVATLYDMLDSVEHDASNVVNGIPFTVRSVFVIDPAKKIRLILTYPASCGRNFDEILRAIDSLQLSDR
ncbi:peroxiredoxin 1, partial [Coemansia sp. RSA 2603]